MTTHQSERLSTAAAPLFGEHLPTPPGMLAIDLATVLGAVSRMPGAGAAGTLGPPGFTRALVPILRAFTSSHYVAAAFSMDLFGKERRRNGDSGCVDFAGCTAKQARALLRVLPEANLQLRVGDAPRAKMLLETVAAHPGRLEFSGLLVGPDSTDNGPERLEIHGLHVFDDTVPDRKGHAWRVIEARYGLDDSGAMPHMRRHSVPWRADIAWGLNW